jgi:hypothetical protein
MQCLTHGKTLNVPASAKAIIDSLDGYECRITPEIKQAAEITIERIQEYHTPCDREWLKGAVYTLLQHYYVRDLPDMVQKAIAQDWIVILGKYPQWAVEKARIEYLEKNDKKPTPKDISELCNKAMSKNNKLYWKCKEVLILPIEEPKKEISQDERDRVIADAKKLLQGVLKTY